MPDASLYLLILIIILAIGFGVVNGFNDAANAIAIVISTRVLPPRNAIILAAFFNFAGAATGLAVARTIGKGILTEEVISQFQYVPVIAALASVIIWTSLATYHGLPVSLTHGFIAGLAAAGMAVAGVEAVVWGVMQRVLSAVVTAPVLGFIGGVWGVGFFFLGFPGGGPARGGGVFFCLQNPAGGLCGSRHVKEGGQGPRGVLSFGRG